MCEIFMLGMGIFSFVKSFIIFNNFFGLVGVTTRRNS